VVLSGPVAITLHLRDGKKAHYRKSNVTVEGELSVAGFLVNYF
jgi:hypothetical protein